MSKVKLQAAREFIQEKRFTEARILLQSIDHPIAREWLVKLDKVETSGKHKGNKPQICPNCGAIVRLHRFALLFRSRKGEVKCKKCGYQLQSNKSTEPSQAITAPLIPSEPSHTVKDITGHRVATTSRALNKRTLPELNEDFTRIFNRMSATNDCVFVTGKAGTGKSTLLKYFVENTHKRVVVLAPTGIAALNVHGQTIHKFFGFPARMLKQDEIKRVPNRELYKKIDTIIIDEISMVRVDMIDNIDKFLRVNREQPSLPFGGVQMIFFGDLYQLPPIVSQIEERKYLDAHYRSEYFFDANVFSQVKLYIEELQTVYRQSDPEFVAILNAIRTGEVDAEHLHRIDSRFNPDFIPTQDSLYITLTTKKDLASQTNEEFLERIPTSSHTYTGIIGGNFDEKQLPVERELTLKVGAQVMFVKNDPNGRWVNGTLGKVHRLAEDSIQVEVNTSGRSQIYTVAQERWENIQYKFNDDTEQIEADVVGFYLQYPLKLAWAITIHKSQGATYERAILDFGNGAFATGQTYVALSRCKTLDGIVLRSKLTIADVKVDPRVQKFMKAQRSVSVTSSIHAKELKTEAAEAASSSPSPSMSSSLPWIRLGISWEEYEHQVLEAESRWLMDDRNHQLYLQFIDWTNDNRFGGEAYLRDVEKSIVEFVHKNTSSERYTQILRNGARLKVDAQAREYVLPNIYISASRFGIPVPPELHAACELDHWGSIIIDASD